MGWGESKLGRRGAGLGRGESESPLSWPSVRALRVQFRPREPGEPSVCTASPARRRRRRAARAAPLPVHTRRRAGLRPGAPGSVPGEPACWQHPRAPSRPPELGASPGAGGRASRGPGSPGETQRACAPGRPAGRAPRGAAAASAPSSRQAPRRAAQDGALKGPRRRAPTLPKCAAQCTGVQP